MYVQELLMKGCTCCLLSKCGKNFDKHGWFELAWFWWNASGDNLQWGMGFLFPMSFGGYDEQAYLNVRLTIKKNIFIISERNAPNCLRLACLCYLTVLKLYLILFYCLKWFIIKTSRKNIVSLTRINKTAKAEEIRIKFMC